MFWAETILPKVNGRSERRGHDVFPKGFHIFIATSHLLRHLYHSVNLCASSTLRLRFNLQQPNPRITSCIFYTFLVQISIIQSQSNSSTDNSGACKEMDKKLADVLEIGRAGVEWLSWSLRLPNSLCKRVCLLQPAQTEFPVVYLSASQRVYHLMFRTDTLWCRTYPVNSSLGSQIHCEIREPTPAPLLWMATARNIVVIDGILDVTQPLLAVRLATCQQFKLGFFT